MASLHAAARSGDDRAFGDLVSGHRRELFVHCYRMLGSHADADDALQETLLAAWRGLPGLESDTALRAWLYRIATRCCLRAAQRRPTRVLSWDHAPARTPTAELGDPVAEPMWLDPWIEPAGIDPADILTERETLGLAYVAALQHLPPNQRAVLILRDVLQFSAAEVAGLLDTSVASVTSALQRARATLAGRALAAEEQPVPDDEAVRTAVEAFVTAFEARDIDAVVKVLAADVRFTMPPLPTWFDGRDDVAVFLADRVFATPWRTVVLPSAGWPTLAGYQHRDGAARLSALMTLQVTDGGITWIASFLDPALLRRLDSPETLA